MRPCREPVPIAVSGVVRLPAPKIVERGAAPSADAQFLRFGGAASHAHASLRLGRCLPGLPSSFPLLGASTPAGDGWTGPRWSSVSSCGGRSVYTCGAFGALKATWPAAAKGTAAASWRAMQRSGSRVSVAHRGSTVARTRLGFWEFAVGASTRREDLNRASYGRRLQGRRSPGRRHTMTHANRNTRIGLSEPS